MIKTIPHPSDQFDINVEDILSKEERLAITLAGRKPYCISCERWTPKGRYTQSPPKHPVRFGTCHAYESHPEALATYCCKRFSLIGGQS